jgi:hypothetical protein
MPSISDVLLWLERWRCEKIAGKALEKIAGNI